MIPRSSIIDNILDDNTGDRVSYVKTTVGYDGTVITPENEATYIAAMSPLYRKKGSDYFRRVTTDGYGFIEWFVGDDLSNGVANLDAIVKLSRVGLKVKLNRGVYPLECATDTTVNTDTQPLFIEGEGQEKTKIILKTKHSISNGVWRYGYFTGSRDITLNNLTLSTQSFEDNILTEIESEYKFCAITKPNKIKVELNSVDTKGSISFVFQHNSYGSASTDAEMLEQYVDILKARDCTFSYASKLFLFRQCYVMTADFSNGYVRELLGNILQAATPVNNINANKLCIWDKMKLINTITPSVTDWYHTPLVYEGDTIYYTNSSVNRLVNTDKTPRDHSGSGMVNGAETYALYASVNNLHFKGNFIQNVLGQKELFPDNCVFKVKGSKNVYCEDNTILLDKQTLVDTGVLTSIDSPYSEINKSTFIYAFFGLGRINVKDNYEFVFKRNKIRIPYLNYESCVPYGYIDLSDNDIEVDHIAIDRDGTDQVLFYNHQSSETFILTGTRARIDNNTIRINSVENQALGVDFMTEKTPNFGATHQTSYSDIFSISNNKFYGENIRFHLGVNRANKLILERNDCFSLGCSAVPDPNVTLDRNDEVPSSLFNYSSEILGSSSNLSIAKPKLWGSSRINVKNNNQTEKIVMNTRLSDWYENLYVSSNTPIVFIFNIQYIDSNGEIKNLQFNFAQTSITNIKYLDFTTGLITDFDPRTNSIGGPIRFADRYGNTTAEVGFYARRYADRRAEFYLSGLSNVSSFRVDVKVEGKTVNGETYYTQLLSVGNSVESLEINKADNTFATTTTKGLIKAADIPSDSTAEDLPTLLLDFNNLLQKLRDQNTEL